MDRNHILLGGEVIWTNVLNMFQKVCANTSDCKCSQAFSYAKCMGMVMKSLLRQFSSAAEVYALSTGKPAQIEVRVIKQTDNWIRLKYGLKTAKNPTKTKQKAISRPSRLFFCDKNFIRFTVVTKVYEKKHTLKHQNIIVSFRVCNAFLFIFSMDLRH